MGDLEAGSASDPTVPIPRLHPLEVARDTFVIRAVTPSVAGTLTSMNSMVIRGSEPMLVDTGMGVHRETWFADVLSLVAPEDVRWIFVTHIDADHAGNLVEALRLCANAKMVCSKGEFYRTTTALGVAPARMVLVEPGETMSIGDRELFVSRPPVYDSPYTRALHDPVTGVYYAADAFCAPMPEGVVDWSDEIAPRLWAKGMAAYHQNTVCPWVSLADPARFRAEVDKVAALDPAVIISSHAAPIGKAAMSRALAQLAGLPSAAHVPLELAGAG